MSAGLSQDIFTLMLTLSKLNDKKLIIITYCCSMEEIFPELQFCYHPPEVTLVESTTFPLRTVSGEYGCMSVEGPLDKAVAEEEMPLLQNSMDYLAVLLEREEQAQQLATQKAAMVMETERRSREMQLFHTQLQLALNAVENNLFVADAKTHEVLFANQHMLQNFGQELVGRKCWEALADRDSSCPDCPLIKRLNKAISSNTPVVWESQRGHSGRWFSNQARFLDWIDGRRVYLGFSTDITEHKQAQNELQRWGQIFKHTGWGMSVSNEDLQLSMVNPAYAAMHGYAPEELQGSPVHTVYPPGYHQTLQEHIAKMGQDDRYAFEMPRLRKDGSEFPAIVDVANIRDDNGKLLYRVANIQDISERKEQEQLILAAKERAEAANHAKDEFLANMSHEIRTPLNGIFGMLQLAQTAELKPELSEYVSTAMSTARNLKAILDDLLDLSRMEAGKMRLRSAPFDLRDSLRTVLGNFSVQARNKNLRLDAVVDQSVPSLLGGDDVRIRQVLFNLVGNAVKFTSAGDVVVSAKALPYSPHDEQINILISVQDTGIGIPEDRVEHIFESFTQMDGSYTRKYGGVGLGLGIVRRIVKMMGGTIAVDSEIGKGTCIYLSIPLQTEMDSIDVDENSCRMINGAPLRVLLAEDDRVSGLVVKRFLRKLGHKPLTASNGREALELLRSERFDAVLMDIQMPLLNGLELTRLIREGHAGENTTTHIIALTAHAMHGDRETFLKAGMDDYLAKPVDMESLCFALFKAMPEKHNPMAKDKDIIH